MRLCRSLVTAKRLNIVAQGQRRSRATLGIRSMESSNPGRVLQWLSLCATLSGLRFVHSPLPRVALHGCAVALTLGYVVLTPLGSAGLDHNSGKCHHGKHCSRTRKSSVFRERPKSCDSGYRRQLPELRSRPGQRNLSSALFRGLPQATGSAGGC